MSVFTNEYLNFRSKISLKRVCVDEEQTWALYDAGPKSVTSPILFLPPASGRADVYFMQLLCLSKLGYRAISIEYPVIWTIREFCLSFNKLLNVLKLGKVHLFGSAIGGFLAMKYAEFTKTTNRVESIILCNSFSDSSVFCSRFPAIPTAIYWVLPSIFLKKLVMNDFDKTQIFDKGTRESMEFMQHSLDSMNQDELASRLVLNCTKDYIQPQYLRRVFMMIIEVNDCDALGQVVTEETSKCFPDARMAQLKSGGNFPFLSRYDDVNVFIQIHLKQFLGVKDCTPIDKESILYTLIKEAESFSLPDDVVATTTPSSQLNQQQQQQQQIRLDDGGGDVFGMGGTKQYGDNGVKKENSTPTSQQSVATTTTSVVATIGNDEIIKDDVVETTATIENVPATSPNEDFSS